ncbi:MAG: AraC family transcriptional regulator [Pseudomonadales bacterium]|nr:AraC family transcriptional regulator [Pseudomonadales bacterium]
MIVRPIDAKALLYLSDKRTMYLGKLAPLLQQSSAASTLIFSIDDVLSVVDQDNGMVHKSRSFLIPAGAKATINTNDSHIGLCYLDALGTDLATLRPKMKQAIPINGTSCFYAGVPNEELVITSARALFSSQAPVEMALEQLDHWIGRPVDGSNILVDERVTRAVEMIKASVVENRSVEEIASELNLSVPRLSQLFKLITGVPVRRFRLWYRIYITAAKMAWGMSLTEAAVSSGFSDSAHFSRTFKEIGGVKPSTMLNAKSHTLIRLLEPIDEAHLNVSFDQTPTSEEVEEA